MTFKLLILKENFMKRWKDFDVFTVVNNKWSSCKCKNCRKELTSGKHSIGIWLNDHYYFLCQKTKICCCGRDIAVFIFFDDLVQASRGVSEMIDYLINTNNPDLTLFEYPRLQSIRYEQLCTLQLYG